MPESKIIISLIGQGRSCHIPMTTMPINRISLERTKRYVRFIFLLYLCARFLWRISRSENTSGSGRAGGCLFLSVPTVLISRTPFSRISRYTLYVWEGVRQYYEDCYIEGTVDFYIRLVYGGYSTVAIFIVNVTGMSRLLLPMKDRNTAMYFMTAN